MRKALPFLLCLGVADLAAQEVVLPTGLSTREGNTWSGSVFHSVLGRHQVVVARSLLTTQHPAWQVSEVWFRRDMTRPVPLQGGTVDLQVWAGNTSSSAEGPEDRFQGNRGSDFGLVFQGAVTLANAPVAGTIPAPWTSTYAIRIPFTQTVHDRGGHLLLEFVSRRAAGQPLPVSWVTDSEDVVSTNAPSDFGQGCSRSFPPPEGSVQREGLRPGTTTVFSMFGGYKGTPVLHVLGFSDLFLLGYPILPLPLDAQGAPGCTLYVDLTSLTPSLSSSDPKLWFGTARNSVRWPLDGRLVGAVGFSQWLLMEYTANALGVTTTNATRFQLTGMAQTGVAWVSAEDLLAATGRVQTHHLPVLRLLR